MLIHVSGEKDGDLECEEYKQRTSRHCHWAEWPARAMAAQIRAKVCLPQGLGITLSIDHTLAKEAC